MIDILLLLFKGLEVVLKGCYCNCESFGKLMYRKFNVLYLNFVMLMMKYELLVVF